MRLLTGLDVDDTDDEQLTRTWIAAHELRLMYRSLYKLGALRHRVADLQAP